MKVYKQAAFERPPRIVVFDLDNTLYPYEPAHAAAKAAAARKANVLFGATPDAFETAYAAARKETGAHLKGTASSHSRLLYFTRLGEKLGLGAQPAIALDLEQTYWTTFLNAATFFPGAIDLLDDLRIARIPMALVTDLTAQIQYRKLVYWGLDQYFSAIVTSEEAGRDKPDEAMFSLLRAKLPEETFADAWIIGDSAEKDVAAGKRFLGASTLLRLDTAPAAAPSPETDLGFDEFGAVRGLLARLTGKGR